MEFRNGPNLRFFCQLENRSYGKDAETLTFGQRQPGPVNLIIIWHRILALNVTYLIGLNTAIPDWLWPPTALCPFSKTTDFENVIVHVE